MHARHTLALALALSMMGCNQSHSPGETGDGGPAPAPDGGTGVCCPISDFSGCSPGDPGRASGGWAATASECTSHLVGGFDGRPFARQVDAHGCPVLAEIEGCCGCVDGGVPTIDAAVVEHCEGLGPAACLDAWCVPVFDDACCPDCTPGECADCTRPTYVGCLPRELSPCLGGPSCGTAPIWGCGPAASICDDAHVVAPDTCDRVGCVPAYPSGTGEPDPSTATCVPIAATSCTVACRVVPPECPSGTTAEGDGSCYTGRCIPAFVCTDL